MLVAVILDLTLTGHVAKKDRGMLLVKKFRDYGHDTRNQEFYQLPGNLSKFFPPR
jgi:nucleobase transporter 1/2